MLLKFLDEVIASLVFPFLTEYNSGFHHHATDVIRHASNSAFHHGRMGHQGTLYLERTNAVTAGLDDVVDTALKPIVAIFITPSHVACVVDAVVPSLASQFLVTIIVFEQSDGLAVAYTHHNLTLLTILAAGAVSTQQVDVILRVGHSHGTGLWCHPREGAEGHGGLCLSKAFHHANACLLEELVVNGRIQGFAGGGAVLE